MAVNNSLRAQSERPKFGAFLSKDAIKNRINQVVGGKDGQRFITSIISAVNANPVLETCEHSSILSAALLGESLKLSPSPQLGYFYLVPFENKKKGCKEAQFILGFKGYLQLAMRTGQYQDLDVIEIREGEYKGRDKLTGKHKFEFIEDEDERENMPIIGYMAYFELVNGFKKMIYWSKSKMEKHADTYSKAFDLAIYKKIQEGKIPKADMWKYSSYWYANFSEMAFKTLLRQIISKWGIMSTEMQSAFEKDNTILDQNGNVENYVETEDDFGSTGDYPVDAVEVEKTDLTQENLEHPEQTSEIPVDVEPPDFLKE